MSVSLQDLIISQGYRLVEDAWIEFGRRTYIHDDDATRTYILGLAATLRPAGWRVHPTKLRSFKHRSTDEIIEIEPGGADTSGHFLHHMTQE